MYTLLIGNGFDLAHKLPTKYSDFMYYLDLVQSIWQHHKEVQNIYIDEKIKNDIRKAEKEKKKKKENFQVLKNTLLEPSKYSVRYDVNLNAFKNIFMPMDHNCWYYYFKDVLKENDNQWIDFEATILEVIKMFAEFDKNITDNDKLKKIDFYDYCKEPQLIRIIKNAMKSDKIFDIEPKDAFKNAMKRDLSKIIKALEQYMVLMKYIPIDIVSADIKSYHFDNVINFNYTDTFRRVYNSLANDKICFLHGRAKPTSDDGKNNIVLGMSNNSVLSPYDKSLQRILKETDVTYKKFLENKKDQEECVLVIFGHSLSPIDGKIIKELIEGYDKTIIYFNDDTQEEEEVRNLMEIYKDKEGKYTDTIERHKAKGKIEFKRQNIMRNINND